jgi:twitching motility protein PilT
MAIDIKNLLTLMVEKDISDIHFKAESVPALRVRGSMILATNLPKLTEADVQSIVNQLMTKEQSAAFEKDMELDLAYSLQGVARFRVNVYRQKGSIGLTLRVVPVKLRTFEELNLPGEPLQKLSLESRGLILFAGITGAGKTTTLNSFLHHINVNHQYRIITIEDPIEFFHTDQKSTIVQREVGLDTHSFASALKHILRQDPDVVVIGEMRDLETMQAAISAAETGHLVLSTIHTLDATQTVDRIVDVHPAHQAGQVRQQLANCLKGVIGQRLVLSADGKSRYPATEVMVGNTLVRRHLLEGKTTELRKVLEGGAYYGMHTFDQDLLRMFSEGKVTEQTVLEEATNPEDVSLRLKSISGAGGN